MNTPKLFEDAPMPAHTNWAARASDPDTSKQAARLPRGSQREKVYNAFVNGPRSGMTDFELSQMTDLLRGTAAKRRSELVHAGLVEATQFRRKTDTGSSAIVFRLVNKI